MARTAFVTGGTGFLGLNLIKELTEQGWQVTALHRPTSNLRYLRSFPVELAEGGITDYDSLLGGMPEGVDAVFHVAGNTNFWRRRNAEQTRDNVDGSLNMARAALERGAKAFIQTSSIAAYGEQEGIVTEETPSNAAESKINYYRTKYLGERAVYEELAGKMRRVIMNPAGIFGPYDTSSWAQLFTLVHKGKLPGVPPGTMSCCHAREVARAHIAAVDKGGDGENFLLGGVDANFVEIIAVVGRLLGKKVPDKPMPVPLLVAVAYLGHWASYITNKAPDLAPDNLHGLCGDAVCSSAKAERELGYKVVPLEEMLGDCYEWMRAEKMFDQFAN